VEVLIRILYVVSTALLIPVILSLLALLSWSLLGVGGLIREYLERRRGRREWTLFYERLLEGNFKDNPASLKSRFFGKSIFPGFLGKFSCLGKRLHENPILLNKLTADLEIEISGRLSRMSFGSRIGPMLGLMGTLIPLGPALIGLASGNVQEMARNLVVAFSTTVLGLAVGGLCYGMSLARRKWYAQDMADIEFILNYLYREKEVIGEYRDEEGRK
jgi:biopolymer transport protein ExbB/TolQ